MNLLDIRTRKWSPVCLEATAPHLDQLLGHPLPSTSVLVRLEQEVHRSHEKTQNHLMILFCAATGSYFHLLCPSIRFLRELQRGGLHWRQPR